MSGSAKTENRPGWSAGHALTDQSGVTTSAARVRNAQRVGMIRKICHLLPNHVLKRIYIAQVRSIMEYGCAVGSGDNISILQKLQDRFCRENHVKLPPVKARFNYLTLLLFYKI